MRLRKLIQQLNVYIYNKQLAIHIKLLKRIKIYVYMNYICVYHIHISIQDTMQIVRGVMQHINTILTGMIHPCITNIFFLDFLIFTMIYTLYFI